MVSFFEKKDWMGRWGVGDLVGGSERREEEEEEWMRRGEKGYLKF